MNALLSPSINKRLRLSDKEIRGIARPCDVLGTRDATAAKQVVEADPDDDIECAVGGKLTT